MIIKVNAKMILVSLVLIVFAVFFGAKELSVLQAGAAAGSESGKIKLPIILYHEINYNAGDSLSITPWEFESDLNYFRQSGYTAVTMTDLIRYVRNGKPLPRKPVVITFDDGYLNNYVYAMPLLKKYGMKAVFSIIAKSTDDFTESESKNLKYAHVTWSQVNEMIDSGCFEIQNHTYNLHSISQNRYGCKKNSGETLTHYETVLTEDLARCQEEIYSKTGVLPNTFTYPYGSVSKESVPIIKKLGFKASLSCKYGINLIGKDPDGLYCLMRISRYHGVSAKKTIETAMKTLKYRKG